MKLFVPKETDARETRVALIPEQAKKLVGMGLSVEIETGSGEKGQFSNAEYEGVGATIVDSRQQALSEADIVLRVRKPDPEEVTSLKPGCLHVSFLDPFNQKDLVKLFAAAKVNAISIEMVPRTTLAQKMDALSSQANIAGYYAVVMAASRLPQVLPLMMTAAGTLAPARFFIIGVGVAGLQAIATAKRLGGRVEAFDTRPVVEEQVKSLGAKFVKIDLGETGQTSQGYAKQLTPDQIKKQQDGMAKVCSQSDVVITTAKLFGRPAPTLVTTAMVERMKPGSVVVDLAAETGGNVEGTVMDQEVVTPNGVKIIGYSNLEAFVPAHASQMYASNLVNLVDFFWDKEAQIFNYELENEILKGCLLTHNGKVVHERFQDLN